MKVMRVLLVIASAALLSSAHAQTVHEVKTWRFTLPHGSLEINLRSYSDGWASLGISPFDQIPEAPIDEQVEPLKQVLGEMPSLGVDPRRLASIGTHLWSRDALEKLAFACVDSEEWRQSMGNGGKGKEKLVIALLNRSGIFEPYNEAFKPYGIQVRVTEAENVGLMHFSRIPPRNSNDRANARILVPADAMLGLRFSPSDSGSSEKKQ